MNANEHGSITVLDKMVPMELVYPDHCDAPEIIGASHGWIATLKDDGILRLQDDLNPVASDTDPKRIPLPPFVTLHHCQTQMVTNVSMSSSSPEDEDCVVAVKFLGPQLSFCRPAQNNAEWTNIRVENPCFYSSRVMYSKKDNMFRIPASGGHLIGSWDLCQHITEPTFQSLQFQNIPELTKYTRELMDSCCTTAHLVESINTGETFLVKWYKKMVDDIDSRSKMKSKKVMVFNVDEQGNAVYTQDIGDLVIFFSRCEPFCVPASSFPGMEPYYIRILDFDEAAIINLAGHPPFDSAIGEFWSPYQIPPQDIIDT
ncbi:hypothetical protein AALP_AA8G330800 [Arabis alpina]|uniref:KIB1-4 beta-propeller domain-containing protein n=1 Tax=Arabis alpina TaxID=50452 RepID=A0A087GB22_ARAAL|nr:hypothetical protein AALP_AA8G330800 [Arabis alpina]